MRLRTTIALLFVSVVLGLILAATNPGNVSDDARTTQAGTVLMPFSPEKVDRLEITHGKDHTVLIKRQGFWFLSKPEADRADPDAMKSLLDMLSHLAIRDVLSDQETSVGSDLAATKIGLEGDDAITLLIQESEVSQSSEDGKHRIVIGKPSPLENTIYATREGDVSTDLKLPHVVMGNPRRFLENAVSTLRDQHLVLIPPDAIVHIGLRLPGGEIEAVRQILPRPSNWRVTRPIQSRADLDVMDRLISGITSLRIDKVINSNALKIPAAGSPLPPGSAVIEMRLQGIDQPLSITLLPTPPPDGEPTPAAGAGAALAATVSDRPATYLVQSDLLATLPAEPKGYRDSHLARIPSSLIRQIEIKSREDPDVNLQASPGQEGVIWSSHRNGQMELADQARVNHLIDAINEEKIIDFASDSPSQMGQYGLNPPALTVTLGLAQPVPGDPKAPPKIVPYTLLLGSTNESTLFANFSGEPFIYALSPAFRSQIPTHPLKWRNLKVLNFNRSSLIQIRRDQPGQEGSLLELNYDYRSDTWNGTQGGKPLGDLLDTAIANRIAELTGSLTATDWLTALTGAYQALAKPSMILTLKTKEYDKAAKATREVDKEFKFATAGGGYYYGIEAGSPDVFLLPGEAYRELLTPIFKTHD
ncbi:MAG: DUF4340 domain-containing protein [Verrucomicrobiales bacterium]|nr:DUF4340 domain-containing protein [Verrucomicrobiales bacterium]